MSASDYSSIADYATVGDLRTVALVSKYSSIDLLCLPEFDSPSVFLKILDAKKGGYCDIRALEPVTSKEDPEVLKSSLRESLAIKHEAIKIQQEYIKDTNILQSLWELPDTGIRAELTDFMPISERKYSGIYRRIRSIQGELCFELRCKPHFHYAQYGHEIIPVHSNERAFAFIAQTTDGQPIASAPLGLCLTIGIEENGKKRQAGTELSKAWIENTEDGAPELSIRCRLRESESAYFTLEAFDPSSGPFADQGSRYEHPAVDIAAWERELEHTAEYWKQWLEQSTYASKETWSAAVKRSALAAKLLHSEKQGCFVAAASFSLPEEIGGKRNWDYRYAWIRDNALLLCVFIELGFHQEARLFLKWVQKHCLSSETIQVLYKLDGSKEVPEQELKHLQGHKASQPVRIGNAAYTQLQLDIYGELMEFLTLYDAKVEPISLELWNLLQIQINWLCENWQRKDESIWEIRGPKREFLYSRVMCWVALDRALDLARKHRFPAPVAKWNDTCNILYEEILELFWSTKRRSFIQFAGGQSMNASTLVMPLVRFISSDDPRWISTLQAIQEDLQEGPFIYRYLNIEEPTENTPETKDDTQNTKFDDGLPGHEGSFTLCSFWHIECLARTGELDLAMQYFQELLQYANHVGLYAEEIDVKKKEQLGNFPQAFSHLGLIRAALGIEKEMRAQEVKRCGN